MWFRKLNICSKKEAIEDHFVGPQRQYHTFRRLKAYIDAEVSDVTFAQMIFSSLKRDPRTLCALLYASILQQCVARLRTSINQVLQQRTGLTMEEPPAPFPYIVATNISAGKSRRVNLDVI